MISSQPPSSDEDETFLLRFEERDQLRNYIMKYVLKRVVAVLIFSMFLLLGARIIPMSTLQSVHHDKSDFNIAVAIIGTKKAPYFDRLTTNLEFLQIWFPKIVVYSRDKFDDFFGPTIDTHQVTSTENEKDHQHLFLASMGDIYKRYPNEDFYILLDDDSMVFHKSLILNLANVNQSEYFYGGKHVFGAGFVYFAVGGSGIIINHMLMKLVAPYSNECRNLFNISYGDGRIGACIRYVGKKEKGIEDEDYIFQKFLSRGDKNHRNEMLNEMENKDSECAVIGHCKDPVYMRKVYTKVLNNQTKDECVKWQDIKRRLI